MRLPVLALALLLAACAAPPAPAPVRFGAEFPPVPRPTSRGSLWVDGRGAGLCGDPIARGRGDVVTILIRESQQARQNEATLLEQETSASLELEALAGFPKAFPAGLPAGKASSARSFDATSRVQKDGSLTARVTAVVVDVLPNGCLVLEGTRAVRVDDETKTLRVTGIVRPQDVTPDNTVLSEDLAEASVSFEGTGPLTRNGSRGLVGSAVDFLWHHLWPF